MKAAEILGEAPGPKRAQAIPRGPQKGQLWAAAAFTRCLWGDDRI